MNGECRAPWANLPRVGTVKEQEQEKEAEEMRGTDRMLGPGGPLLGLYVLLKGEDFEQKGDLSL